MEIVTVIGLIIAMLATSGENATVERTLGPTHALRAGQLDLVIGQWTDGKCDAYLVYDDLVVEVTDQHTECHTLAAEDPENARFRLHLRARASDSEEKMEGLFKEPGI